MLQSTGKGWERLRKLTAKDKKAGGQTNVHSLVGLVSPYLLVDRSIARNCMWHE